MLALNTSIEFAKAPDAIEISELSRKFIEFDLRRMYTPSRIHYLIKNTSSNVVVARRDRALVGFGIMTYKETSANLDLLAIKNPYRRRGVGTQVVQWLEIVALTAGVINVFIQVRETNVGAILFYETLGFHIIDEVPGYYQERETGVIMCKGIRQMVNSIQSTSAKGDDQ